MARLYFRSMNQRQLYLAAYDISSPSRLRLGLKVLRRYASGGQKSVFECFLNASEKASLLAEIDAVITRPWSSFRPRHPGEPG